MSTPSIAQALSGNFNNSEKTKNAETEEPVSEEVFEDKGFTIEQLHEVWPAFTEKFKEQSHIYNTLLNKPTLTDNFIVVIAVENSVQQDKIRFIKHEIIGHLRRTLQNSKIDVEIELLKSTNTNRALTDEQKMKAMMQKNPALVLLKNKFNLDFNG